MFKSTIRYLGLFILTVGITLVIECRAGRCDAPHSWAIGFQDPSTPVITSLIKFHNDVIVILFGISIFVFWLLFRAIINFTNNKKILTFTHATNLEIIWTLLPACLLLIISVPSFSLLYFIDDFSYVPDIIVKGIGHQWYWSYEYDTHLLKSTRKGLRFDAYMSHEEDITLGGLRLLEVDHRTKLPINRNIKFLITSSDVLHSWAVPSLGVKIDACPGRLNQVNVHLLREGVFYGQCSEICGLNHGFIPIVIEGVLEDEYFRWLRKNILKS